MDHCAPAAALAFVAGPAWRQQGVASPTLAGSHWIHHSSRPIRNAASDIERRALTLSIALVAAAFCGSRRHQTGRRAKIIRKATGSNNAERALIFDCDGVIAESEHLHREAYNQVFTEFKLGTSWSKEYYDELQNKIGGGKPKMRYHFSNNGWPGSTLGPPPSDEEAQAALIDALQDRKTEIYLDFIVSGRCCARPGILALVDEGLGRPDLKTAICSASTRSAASQVLKTVLGEERLAQFDVVLLGDDVSRKKPDPLIYTLASQRLGISPANCAVVEDSKIGLDAALAANMNCYITYTESTQGQDFTGAEQVVPDASHLTLAGIFSK